MRHFRKEAVVLKDRLLELGLFSPGCQLASLSQYGHPKNQPRMVKKLERLEMA